MDVRLNYYEVGEGPTLIMLHGNGGDHTCFFNQFERFADSLHMVAVDTRGHGESPRGTAPFTLGQFAEDMHDFMDERGIDRAHILGYSDGANIAMIFSLKYPERVGKLVLNGGNLDPSGVKRRVQLSITASYLWARLRCRWNPEAVRDVEMLRLMVEEPHIDPADLARIGAPTLVMAGTKDVIRESHTRLIQQSIPGARLAIVEGDHGIVKHNPVAYNDVLAEFLLGATRG